MAVSQRRLGLLDSVGMRRGGGKASPSRTPTASRIPITKSPSRRASAVSTAAVPSPLNDLSWRFSSGESPAPPAPAAPGRPPSRPPVRPKAAPGRGAAAQRRRESRSEEEAIQGLQELVRRQQEELEQYRDDSTAFLLSSSLVKQVTAQHSPSPPVQQELRQDADSQDHDAALPRTGTEQGHGQLTELSIDIPPAGHEENYSVQVDGVCYDGPLQVKSLPQPRLEDLETSSDVLEDPRLAATRNRLNQRLQHLLDGQVKDNSEPQRPPAATSPAEARAAHKEQYHQEIRQLLQKLHCEDGYAQQAAEPIYAVSSKCKAAARGPSSAEVGPPLEQNVQPAEAERSVAGSMSSTAVPANESDDDGSARGSGSFIESSSDGASGSGDDGIGKQRTRRQRARLSRMPPACARDLSMDSGIQGSSCDLDLDLDIAADSSSASDALEDDEPLAGAVTVRADAAPPPAVPAPTGGCESPRPGGGGGGGGAGGEGEAFKVVEELYVAGAVAAGPVGHRPFTETHFDSAPDLSDGAGAGAGAAAGAVFHSSPVISSLFRCPGADLCSSSVVSLPSVPTQSVQQAQLGTPAPAAPGPAVRPAKRFSSADDVFRASLLRHSLPAKPPRTPSLRIASENGLVGSIRQLVDVDEGGSKQTASDAAAVSPDSTRSYDVVVAIDFGTTYTGYAFAYTRDPENNIHMMRKWEGGDPGLHNEKAPTALLLTPEGKFHSFGFLARDTFHDLHPDHAKRWLYFDKFKMALLSQTTLSRDTPLAAANGRLVPALTVLSLSLRHLRERALAEIASASGAGAGAGQSAGQGQGPGVRWVLTVPALWAPPATQLLREAAHQAGLEDLLIVLEPEAASLCCRQLRLHQLLHLHAEPAPGPDPVAAMGSLVLGEAADTRTQYMVVDCGGGTVDITVHELTGQRASLRELHKASGGACGSLGVDREFERLLSAVFGADFMSQFRRKRPAAYVELLLAFEARKRSADPDRDAGAALCIFPPYAFIEAYRKFRGKEVEHAVRKYGRPGELSWSSQGMLRLSPRLMAELFRPTLDHICAQIEDVLRSPRLRDRIHLMFLVGGFSQSLLLQRRVRQQFGERLRVVVPQGVGLTTLRGAVLFGLDPGLVVSRRSTHTIGVGVLKRFQPGEHPQDKLVRLSDGSSWCCDVLDVLVLADQALGPGEAVTRSYTPASARQTNIIIHIYCCSDSPPPQFVTDPGVSRCGTLRLSLAQDPKAAQSKAREIVATIEFGGTEMAASAHDVSSGRCVRTQLDFLSTAV